jgi:hypothetical protein
MTLDIRRWNVRHLVSASAAYWAGLAAVTLAPFTIAVASVARLSGNRGSATGSLGDAGVTLTALKDGVPIYTGTTPLLHVALWIAVPPLALWLVWLAMRPSRADADAPRASPSLDALPNAARAGWNGGPMSPPSQAPVERREHRG